MKLVLTRPSLHDCKKGNLDLLDENCMSSDKSSIRTLNSTDFVIKKAKQRNF